MERNHRVLWGALVIACLGLTALTFAANSRRASVNREAYVRRRLDKPGRGRLHLTGTLSRANDSQIQEVDAVFEFPERLRLTMQRGNQTRVISFDGEHPKAEERSFAAVEEEDLIETLVYGSAEHFFNTQMQGLATRLLGSRFFLHRGSTADYNGPYYNVYKVIDQVKTSGGEREQLKLYYFNSDTLLLERVTYEIKRNGTTVKVEERLGNWSREQGQQIARRIERFENGESVFVFTVRTVGLSARADAGVFGFCDFAALAYDLPRVGRRGRCFAEIDFITV